MNRRSMKISGSLSIATVGRYSETETAAKGGNEKDVGKRRLMTDRLG